MLRIIARGICLWNICNRELCSAAVAEHSMAGRSGVGHCKDGDAPAAEMLDYSAAPAAGSVPAPPPAADSIPLFKHMFAVGTKGCMVAVARNMHALMANPPSSDPSTVEASAAPPCTSDGNWEFPAPDQGTSVPANPMIMRFDCGQQLSSPCNLSPDDAFCACLGTRNHFVDGATACCSSRCAVYIHPCTQRTVLWCERTKSSLSMVQYTLFL